jgi:hypothetical protein
MTGAVAAISSYDGTGTQGGAVTNQISGGGQDVQSVFYNRNDVVRQVLHGTSIVEIPIQGNGGSLTSGAGNQVFNVNSDFDALGDLYLQISLTGTNGSLNDNKTILDVIKRIEFKVGSLTWNELYKDDIHALNSTELSEAAFESYFYDIAGGRAKNGLKKDGVNFEIGETHSSNGTRLTTHKQSSNGELTCVIRLPSITRTVSPHLACYGNVSEGAYLQAAATGQSITIKVYTNAIATVTSHTGVELKLFGKKHLMTANEVAALTQTNTERAKKVKTSQHFELSQTPTPILSEAVQDVIVDLDAATLFASHLIISLSDLDCHIKTAELKLNSTSFSGELDGALLTGAAADALGLNYNQFYASGVGLTHNYYIFPLASQAYGASSVPLDRFDNVRLHLSIKNQAKSAAAAATLQRSPKICVTCVGQGTVQYLNGAAMFAAF